MRDLRGAVVAITGASAGIGRECALGFAREGARLLVGARRRDRLDDLAADIESRGGTVRVEVVDVAVREDVERLVGAAVSRFGRLDVLVNNAGYGTQGLVEKTPPETFERVMRVNYLGTVYGCRAAIPIMRRQGGGVIVNVSSIVGHRAMPGSAAYCASKAAQISLTEALRVELAGSGISVCSVHPIGTETEFREVVTRESGAPIIGVGPQQSAAVVARSIVRCAKRPRPEVYPYPPARLLVWLNALLPGFVDRLGGWSARRSGRL
jgi:NAD(P)-dependent dehydrogenase (short-subunit alcohol dehydrogenase family)